MKTLILSIFAALALSACGQQSFKCQQVFDLADGTRVAVVYTYLGTECSAVTESMLSGQQIEPCDVTTPKQISIVDTKGNVNKLTFNQCQGVQ
jgi:hypothetical protein